MDCLGHYADLTSTVWAAICRTSACAKRFTWKSLDFHANDSTRGIYFHTNSSHKDSFCHRGKSKLGIGLLIHELLREPLITLWGQIECWPFDVVSRAFCDFRTRTRLLAFINYLELFNYKVDWKAPGSPLQLFMAKDTVSIWFMLWDVLKMFFGGLRTFLSSPIITLNLKRGTRLIQPVTSLGCFGRTKMAANFGLNQPTSNGCKSSFPLPYAKKKSAVFPSKVKTLLLSKNLTYKNFVSVAL